MGDFAIAVGSNRGDRAAILMQAARDLCADGFIALRRASRLYETEAVGGPRGQGAFLNGVWIIASDLGPHQILHRLQALEHAAGRTRTVAWGPRTLDLDLILAADGRVVHSAVLDLPHPRLHLRRFVLEPLAEVAGSWRHPLLGMRVAELLVRVGTSDAGTAGRGT